MAEQAKGRPDGPAEERARGKDRSLDTESSQAQAEDRQQAEVRLSEAPGARGQDAREAGEGTGREEPAGHHLRDRFPRSRAFSVLSFYVVITFIILFILTKVGNNLDKIALALGAGMRWLKVVLVPLALGFALAYLFTPVVRFIQKRISRLPLYRRSGRSALGAATGLTLALVMTALLLGLTTLISAFTHELTVVSFDSFAGFLQDLTKSLQDVYTQLDKWLDQLNISSDVLQTLTQSLSGWVGGLAEAAADQVGGVVSHLSVYLVNSLFAVIFAIYFTLDAEGLKRYWKRFVKALLPQKASHTIGVAIRDADQVFSGYIRGQLIDALFMAIAVSIALLLLNVKFAVIIGVLTGFGNLIPYVGPFVAYGCTGLVGILSQDWKRLAVSILVLFLIQTLDGNVVNPRLLSHAVKVHPMLVIIALLIGSKVGGLAGMILAVPLAALLKTWLDRGIDRMAEGKRKRGQEGPGA